MTDDPRAELRISCADAVELVTDYLEGALQPHDVDDYTTHLASCQPCRVFLDQVRVTRDLAGRLRVRQQPVTPPETLLGRLRRRRA